VQGSLISANGAVGIAGGDRVRGGLAGSNSARVGLAGGNGAQGGLTRGDGARAGLAGSDGARGGLAGGDGARAGLAGGDGARGGLAGGDGARPGLAGGDGARAGLAGGCETVTSFSMVEGLNERDVAAVGIVAVEEDPSGINESMFIPLFSEYSCCSVSNPSSVGKARARHSSGAIRYVLVMIKK